MFEDKIKLVDFCSKIPFILFYQGNYEETPTNGIVKIVEKDQSPFFDKKRVKTLLYLVIEALQNIERYSSHTVSSDDYALIYSDHDFFHIYTQNIIDNEKIDSLKKRLDNVLHKNKEQLTEAYNQVLSAARLTEKGAGLGLIDLARKSNNHLFYEFANKTEQYSTYSLGVSVPLRLENSNKSEGVDETKFLISMLRANFLENKSTLFYSGNFSASFIISLLKLNKAVKKEDLESNKIKLHHILVELTQNVRNHGTKVKDAGLGQLFIEWKEKSLSVTTFNQIDEAKASK